MGIENEMSIAVSSRRLKDALKQINLSEETVKCEREIVELLLSTVVS